MHMSQLNKHHVNEYELVESFTASQKFWKVAAKCEMMGAVPVSTTPLSHKIQIFSAIQQQIQINKPRTCVYHFRKDYRASN